MALQSVILLQFDKNTPVKCLHFLKAALISGYSTFWNIAAFLNSSCQRYVIKRLNITITPLSSKDEFMGFW